MKDFFKFFFASCLGFVVGVGVLGIIGISITSIIISSSETAPSVANNAVLKISLSDYIPDHTNNLETGSFSLKEEKILGLRELQQTLANAAEDDRIKGIFLEAELVYTTGLSTVRDLRQTLVDFKSSGKFIIAHAKNYTQNGYYLASVADQMIVHPLGIIDIRGLSAQIPFYKNMLDKIGIDMQVFFAGQYKSATEPYRRTDMSPQNRLQVRSYLNQIYDNMLDDISESRGINEQELRKIFDNFEAGNPPQAAGLGIINQTGYRDDALNLIRQELDLQENDNIDFISLQKYNMANPPDNGRYTADNRIAIVYAEGAIIDGKSANGNVGDRTYSRIFKEIADNEKIKAVVLRINSPGGSALSAENIHHSIQQLKEAGKPVIVSMGDYAASAGYYIACHADTILATPNTLTGSIGVFLLLPNAKELLNENLGISFDTVRTGKFSAGITPFYNLTPAERKWMEKRTEDMYQVFLERVAAGRNMSVEEVHKIAQGRVWTGNQALEVGLIDAIGDLEDAVNMAIDIANVENYRILEYPVIKPPFQQLLEEFVEDVDTDVQFQKYVQSELPELSPYFDHLMYLKNAKGPQARLPFFIPCK